jgi:Ca2+-binding EF-hand superfamily protein
MSIGGISGGVTHYLSSLLSALSPARPAAAAASASAPSFASSVDCGPAAPAGAAAPVTAPSQSLSDEILALLTQLQASVSDAGGAAAASTSIAAASASASPLQQLMSAADGDGDGTISESEFESYIQKQGGTKDQADALFSGLNQGSTGDLTQTQLAGDLQQARPAGAAHGHHHHHKPPSADRVGNDLVQAMDTDGDGTVDQSEFTSFVTAQGGTAAQAMSDFAALDPNGSGSVSAAQFSNAVSAFEHGGSAVATGASPIMALLDAFSRTPAPVSTTSVIA